MRLLNFGCGATYHPDWTNLDASPLSPDVTAHDLRRRFPFADATYDAAYGSHVLEHLEPDAASLLLRECHRILRPGGILRIVVPDLETIARLYLDSLERAASGDNEAAFRYDWMMLELYDQTVRTTSGGRMAARLADNLPGDRERFIESRVGAEAMGRAASSVAGVRQPRLSRALRRLRTTATRLRGRIAEACALLVLGREGTSALRAGLFRQSGEIHQWMYDRFSLRRAMEQAGFGEVRACAADESGIPAFARFGLETRDNRPRRPDSLYVEGKKPAMAGTL